MKFNEQLIPLELAKRLKELGVKQDSLFYWHNLDSIPSVICEHWYPERSGDFFVSAFTAYELMGMLPENINDFWFVHRRGMLVHEVAYAEDKYNTTIMRVENESYEYCLAKMLIKLLETGMHKL